MKIDDITTLRCFKLIYETRSLTKASLTLALSKAAISKRLDHLETALDFKLFSRANRTMIPTANADTLITQVNEILTRIDSLSLSTGIKANTQLKIKITCIASMSQSFMGELLQEYRMKHPGLVIELVITDSILDIVEHGVDLAIRYRPSNNSDLVGKKLGQLKLYALATPAYLKKHGPIKKIEDLLQHELLFTDAHVPVLGHLPKVLQNSLKARRLLLTNDSPLITKLVLKGHGVGIRSSWDAKDPIKNKKLVYALPENYFKPQGDVWILSGPDRLKSEAVRNLYEFLIERIVHYLD